MIGGIFMTIEFIFKDKDHPGVLREIAETLGDAGVNIDGIEGIAADGTSRIHLVSNDTQTCRQALEAKGIDFQENEVLLINLKDVPGAIAKIAKPLSDAGVNLTTFYITMSGKQVLGADNLDKAREIAKKEGIEAV
jgi:hypothetical protein